MFSQMLRQSRRQPASPRYPDERTGLACRVSSAGFAAAGHALERVVAGASARIFPGARGSGIPWAGVHRARAHPNERGTRDGRSAGPIPARRQGGAGDRGDARAWAGRSPRPWRRRAPTSRSRPATARRAAASPARSPRRPGAGRSGIAADVAVAGAGRGDGRPDARRVRPDRHPGQQRRDQHPRADRAARRGGLGRGDRHEPERPLALLPRGGRADEGPEVGAGDQRLEHARRDLDARPHALCLEQGGPDAPDQDAGPGVGRATASTSTRSARARSPPRSTRRC